MAVALSQPPCAHWPFIVGSAQPLPSSSGISESSPPHAYLFRVVEASWTPPMTTEPLHWISHQPNDQPSPKPTFLPIAEFRQPISRTSMENTPVRMPEAIRVAKLQMAEDGGLPSSVNTGKSRFFQPVGGFESTRRTGTWGGFVSSASTYLNELRNLLFIQALGIYSFFRVQLKKLAGAVTKLAGLAGFAIACVALWSALSSMHDTRQALVLAQWTARKDFLQYCHSVRETT